MSDLSQKDNNLLEAIRRGDSEEWSQLVNEYQGRLLRFAMARVPQRAVHVFYQSGCQSSD